MKSTTLSTIVGALTFSTACVDNDSSMYVEGMLAMTPPNCELNADPGAPLLLRGTLDVAFLDSYQGAALVASQLTPRGAKNQLRTETQGVSLDGAEVTVTRGERVLGEFSVPAGGFVNSTRSESPGYGLAVVTLIPPGITSGLRGELPNRGDAVTVIAEVRVFGTTLGGTDITSGAFTFPIDVCRGCLIDFPIDAIEATNDGRICAGSTEGVATSQCIRGQDALIDCRTCAATLDECAFLDTVPAP